MIKSYKVLFLFLISTISNFLVADDIKQIYYQAVMEKNKNNYEEAVKLFSITCNRGHSQSCSVLTDMYSKGTAKLNQNHKNKVKDSLKEMYYKAVLKNDKKEYIEAAKLFLKACNRGLPQSCYDLAELYYQGMGVNKNYKIAAEFFQRACKKGNAEACYKLGYMYQEGLGLRQSYGKVVKFYGKACDRNHAVACDELGSFYRKELRFIKSKKYYGKACDLGLQVGCNHYRGDDEKNYKEEINF